LEGFKAQIKEKATTLSIEVSWQNRQVEKETKSEISFQGTFGKSVFLDDYDSCCKEALLFLEQKQKEIPQQKQKKKSGPDDRTTVG
jgi:hypothetical protein